MIDRICISINNRCNLNCKYCHFHEKHSIVTANMDVMQILENVKAYANHVFKIGFVGNGEPFLDFPLLKSYISYIADNKWIQAYTITNGTVNISDADIRFLEEHGVNVGFSIDGYPSLHNANRCNSFEKVMENVNRYHAITGHYPTFNATVGKETLQHPQEVIDFFRPFGTRVTFSRMIGKYGITLEEYQTFIMLAEKQIPIRRGGLDCTMYGGQCGAGINNYFFANGKIFYCGNCVDLPPIGDSSISFFELEKVSLHFNRENCYKEKCYRENCSVEKTHRLASGNNQKESIICE